jgi:hypothetical protein
MLGPALKQLFFNLHHRTDPPLTKYEAAVHRELLGILLTEQFERRILGARSDALFRAAGADSPADVEVSGSSLDSIGIPEGISEIFGSGPTMNLQVVLSGGDWGNSPTMISCGAEDCNYKTPVG